MCALFPPIEPYNYGFLEVSKVHKIYFEECGNKTGIPAVFLHGGPGAGCSGRDRQYFDPNAYRIILFDQRGSGKSVPEFCTDENDTWKMIDDMEKIRTHLGIEKWLILGGSWGSTLALVYAEAHIDRVLGLVLHGIFLFRQQDIDWLYQEGASNVFSDYWDDYVAAIPEDERVDYLSAYFKRFQNPNPEVHKKAVKVFVKYELAITRLRVVQEKFKVVDDPKMCDILLKGALFECHFYINKGFLSANQILDNVKIIRESGVPVTIIQGRYDMVTPFKTAWELYKNLPTADFVIVEDAGHSSKEDGMTKGLVEACNKYKNLLKK